jgi:hypothetical protein
MEGLLFEPKTSFLNSIGRDVWEHISLFLSLNDFIKLKLCSKNIQTRLRVLFFKRFRVIITKDVLKDPCFQEVINYASAFKIDFLNDLGRLVFLKKGTIFDIKFGFYFDQIANNLPSTLTHLTFGYYFNQSVEKFPLTLTHLTFELGGNFDQRVDGILSPTLVHLSLGRHFNQSVEKLPSTLKYLCFGACFNQRVDNLPPTLTHLTFGYYFDQSITNLPRTLLYLTISKRYRLSIPSWIPKIRRV